MVVPLLLGAAVGLSAVYQAGKAYDNIRYWNDYSRRYGVRPKYPWRSGRYDYVNYASKALGAPSFAYKWYNSGYHPSRFRNDYGMYR